MANVLTSERIQAEILDELTEKGFEVKIHKWSRHTDEEDYKISKGAFKTWFEMQDGRNGLYLTYKYENRRLKHTPRIIEKIMEDYRIHEEMFSEQQVEKVRIKNVQNALTAFGLERESYQLNMYSKHAYVKTTFDNFIKLTNESMSYSSHRTVTIDLIFDGGVNFEFTINDTDFTVENIQVTNKSKEKLALIWGVATL